MAMPAEQHQPHRSATVLEIHDTKVPFTQAQRHSFQAFRILYLAFSIAPLVAGLDKFTHYLVNWDQYLSPMIARLLPISAHRFMNAVGFIEIAAGILVVFKPRIGGYVVSAWLLGIVLNLLTFRGFWDIALRDFGLALGALALARLSETYDPAYQKRAFVKNT